MNRQELAKIKRSRHCWTIKDTYLGLSDTLIPANTEGIFLTGHKVNNTYLVWFYTLSHGELGLYKAGAVPADSIRW